VVNLKNPTVESTECSNAKRFVKPNLISTFHRNIGSISNIRFYLRGNELQIVTTSDSDKKCGKNDRKNVTSVIMLQCSSSAGLGQPEFLYESNDCDYIFTWDTSLVCPSAFLTSIPENVPSNEGQSGSSIVKHRSSSGLWMDSSLSCVCFLPLLACISFMKGWGKFDVTPCECIVLYMLIHLIDHHWCPIQTILLDQLNMWTQHSTIIRYLNHKIYCTDHDLYYHEWLYFLYMLDAHYRSLFSLSLSIFLSISFTLSF